MKSYTMAAGKLERRDSLWQTQLILALEDEIGVTSSDDDIPELLSLSAISNSVGQLAH